MTQKRLRDLVSPDCLTVIMGATASGKSSLALLLARNFSGEIISADSMQFYRGLEIGVAKPTSSERAEIQHHLLDTMDISEKSDIFRFCNDAQRVIAEIRGRAHLPIVVGGSGLYLHALIYGLDPLPAKQELRDELDAKYDNEEHFPELVEYMKQHCPQDCARFSMHRRKLIRACEVYQLSGKQMSDLQSDKKNAPPCPDVRSFVLCWDRDVLKQRIRQRAEEMLNSGWIEEARTMIAQGLLNSPTAWQA